MKIARCSRNAGDSFSGEFVNLPYVRVRHLTWEERRRPNVVELHAISVAIFAQYQV